MGKTCNKSHCAGCAHYRPLSEKRGSGPRACHYILDTGHMRGCAPSDCTTNRAGRHTAKGAAA